MIQIQFSEDKSKLDLEKIFQLLSNSYQAQGRSRDMIKKSIEKSFCVGIYFYESQIGFARVITDYCTFAYLCDVIIDENYRHQKIGHQLLKYIIEHNELKSVKWLLKTSDAQKFYEDFM